MRQTFALVRIALRALPSRVGTSSVVILGSVGLVVVLCFFLAMQAGLQSAIVASGHPDRAIVLRQGSDVEITSRLPHQALDLVNAAPGVLRGIDGKPMVSPEIVRVIDVPAAGTSELLSFPIRAVGSPYNLVHPEIKLIAGRAFNPGTTEFIVGRALYERTGKLAVGSTLNIKGTSWLITGMFEAGKSSIESELITDVSTLESFYKSPFISSVTVRLKDNASFDGFRNALIGQPALALDVRNEFEYYERQAGASTALLTAVAYIVGGLMATGAVLAAMNALHSSIGKRTSEIAILRSMGFENASILAAIIAEAVLLAGFGAILGSIGAGFAFKGMVVSTLSNGVSQTAFHIDITPQLITQAMLWAMAVGVVAGIPPALRATRLKLVAALRAL